MSAAAPKPTPSRPARDDETCSCGKPARVVLLFDEYGPVPSCDGGRDGDHRPADCPPWCTDEHRLVFDRVHYGDTHGVELDAHPYLVQISGKWEHCRHSILAGIIKDSADRPAYIEISGQDDKPTSRLTAYEADQLAEILHALAATLRGEDEAGQ